MGNGASTAKVISIKSDSEIGHSLSDFHARPISRAQPPERSSPILVLPGAVLEYANEKPKGLAEAGKSDSFHRKSELIESLQRSLKVAEDQVAFYKSKILLDHSLPAEEQWAVISREITRLKEQGYNFQDQRHTYFEQTCLAQTQLIQRQERDLAQLREDNMHLKEKCERRVKRERTNSAKKAAEISLQVYELKEQIARLSDANSLLQRQLESFNTRVDSKYVSLSKANSDDRNEEAGDSHMMLVLELSTRINELTDELDEAQATVAKLSGK